MRFPTWLRFAVPIDGQYWRAAREPPAEPPRRREQGSYRRGDSDNLPENGPPGAAVSGGKSKWIYLR